MRSLLIVSLLAASVSGQTTYSLSGSVLDPVAVPVEGATVRARNTQTGAVATAVTSRDGKYTLEQLAPGRYDVSINGVPAMSNVDRKDVVVGAAPAALDLRMEFNGQLGTLGEDRVNVTADMGRHKPPAGPTPRTKDGKPDFSGVWWRPSDVDGGGPQFLAAAEAVAKERRDRNSADSPQVRCLPGAVLRFGPMFEMVQSEKYLVIMNDDESPGFHQVYLNARYPADPNPAWYGHNTASWDGDTLVVDRIAFDERIWLDQGGHPHSPALHVIERYRRPDLGHLESEVTVEDAGVLSKPYTIKRVAELAQGYDLYEFICAENERDAPHMVGK
ncbi:MAG TPA: carboxypeptidase-like regulatory domain-containing protein [Bryobacteraceae bacterium]